MFRVQKIDAGANPATRGGHRWKRALAHAFFLCAVLLLSGCGATGHQQSFQEWLAQEPRTILLVVEPPVADGVYHVMETRYGAAAAAGAGAGAAGWLEAGGSLSGCSGEGAVLCLILWVAMFPIIVAGGAIAGAATAEPVTIDSWMLDEAELTRPLAPVFAEQLPVVTDRLGTDLATAFRQHGGHTVVLVVRGENKGAEPAATVTVRLHTAEILGQSGNNPKIRLRLRAYANATWPTGVENRSYEYVSAKARMTEWRDDNATAPRETFDEAATFLTRRIVGRLLLPPKPAGPGS